MNFAEQAAELHRLEAVALSLSLSDDQYEAILRDVDATSKALPDDTPAWRLAEIRRRIPEAAR
ncbi:hypothetical protein [Methylobacterium sp. WCS2018Hpa-22]|uniref:hypothetical protein n=1 Tax=Methylobacterium sp. WCS2018Hpa-22 TaxID=3073633 RepID=UPI00288C5A12|nr:hypothetical protein [Methylobacterium sp. WCS2018Hpa-22]